MPCWKAGKHFKATTAMATSPKIQWTDCTKINADCKNCFAERMAKRLQATSNQNYIDGFNLAMHERLIELPLRWKKPRSVFVSSMSDMFHEELPSDFIRRVFDVMGRVPQHWFQVLTKRSQRLLELNVALP